MKYVVLIIIIFIFITIITYNINKKIIERFKDIEYEKEIDISKNDGTTREKMKKFNVIFGGACRNVEPFISKVLDNLEICGKKFNKYCIVIYENDSHDKTREILLEKKKENYTYIFEDNIEEPSRTKRLENGRNKVIDTIRKINENKDYHFFINLDMDNVNYQGKFIESIENCFINESWDVLFANQIGEYYDIWALRKENYFNEDCWLEPKNDLSNEILKSRPDFKSNKLIEVNSAFGGTAIYRLSSLPDKCRYNGTHTSGSEKCEHVDFNECIKSNGGKLYINTSFYNDA